MGRQLNPQTAPLYIGPHAPTNFVNHQNVHMNEDHVKTCKGHQKFEGKRKRSLGCQECNIFLCKTCHAKWHSAQTKSILKGSFTEFSGAMTNVKRTVFSSVNFID